ncbi:hypothetical protein OW763_05495 [Clostridium aestuarii]|uniref:Transposase n=1 Tax=Clostridium aestuarii TaxID=338193 RepID=A0ABT4CZJ2_9CLOT|nr:hypothetical protein [Clostridium aestuarii]MCY6483802.1 hypothetical protein [Clostridium aestuarii]
MQNEKKDINWNEIMEKFSTHKGKIVDFCRDHNIKPQQLYRQRKKSEKTSTQTFHTIDMSKTVDSKVHPRVRQEPLGCKKWELYY